MRPLSRVSFAPFQQPECIDVVRHHQNGIDKFKIFTCRQRFDFKLNVAILTVSTALFLMFAFHFGNALDGFAIRNIYRLKDRFYAVFPFHFRHDVIEMDIAHATNEDLLAFDAFSTWHVGSSSLMRRSAFMSFLLRLSFPEPSLPYEADSGIG